MSDPTSYSPCGQAIMKFLSDCYICMKFQNFNEYFTPLQVGISLDYAEPTVRRQIRILLESNHVERHVKFAMYRVTSDLYQKYLADKKAWIPKPTIPIYPRNQYMKKRITLIPSLINTKVNRKN